MKGIEEALGRTSLCATLNRVKPKRIPDVETNVIIQLRNELNEKDELIERLKEKHENCSESGDIVSEIAYLKSFLGDKVSGITQMKEELARKDLDSFGGNAREITKLERKIGNYHQDIINISQKLRQLIAKKETKTQNSLNTFVAKCKKVIVISVEISKDIMKQTKLKYGGCGLEISATASNTLSAGDRIIEVNAENVVNIDRNTWHEMRRRRTIPYHGVIMRVDKMGGQDGGIILDNNALQDNISLIQTRLEIKLREGRNIANMVTSVKEERDRLQMENTRLSHRIAYLEEIWTGMEGGMKQVE